MIEPIQQHQVGLYRLLFNTRDDVFARYWEDVPNKKFGYAPVYRLNRTPQTMTDNVVLAHLQGNQTVGVYPLFPDNTTSFLVIDFDGDNWLTLINQVVRVAESHGFSPSIERSRSGSGGHLWFFFTERFLGFQARQFGKLLLNHAGIKSRRTFDRMFPSQDEHTGKGYGNLICLPLQGRLVQENKTVFITQEGEEISDQWTYLQSIKKISKSDLEQCLRSVNSDHSKSFFIKTIDTKKDKSRENEADNEKADHPISTTQGQQVKLILDSAIFIPNPWLPDKLYRFLKKELNFPNPEFYEKERFGYSTWQTPRWIKTLEVVPDGIRVPIGYFAHISQIATDNTLSVDITDLRITTKKISFPSQLKLRKDQQKALNQLYQYERAILEAHPGFGKTMVALSLMKKRHQKTLVIVHTNTLLHQWQKRICDYFNMSKEDVGLIGNNKWKIGEKVTIASYMTLARRGTDDIKNEFGLVIVDECHHVPAHTFSSVVKCFAAKYALGLTATVFRKDQLEKLMYLYISDQTVSVGDSDQKPTQNIFHTVETKLITRKTEFLVDSPVENFQEASRLVIADDKRNEQIANDIVTVLASGSKCLVLTERLEHCEKILEVVRRKIKGVHAAVATGMMTKKQRERIAKRMNQERFQLLIATGKLIGEGFDWPAVSHLFLAFPFSWKGKLIHYVGRVQRICEGKTLAVVHDYFDEQVPMLKLMYFKRLRTYRSLGLTKIVSSVKKKTINDDQLSLF